MIEEREYQADDVNYGYSIPVPVGIITAMKICKINDCDKDTSKGSNGLCGMHYQRVKRYGNPNYVTPERIRAQRQRKSILSGMSAKPGTYLKYYGRHLHRKVAEEKIGRTLKKGEIVHHIDGNKHNNSPANLEVMTQSEHMRTHKNELRAGRKRMLTDEQAREIKSSPLGGAELYRTGKYPVSVWVIYRIKRGLSYRDS